MSISFNNIPTNLRVPFVYVEFDNSKAQQGPAVQQYKALVLGQKRSAGAVAELVPTVITSEAQARTAFGVGSQIHGMLAKYLENDKITELVAIAIDDHASGVAATGTLTITGPATADGVLAVYIAGRKVAVSIASGDVQNDIATSLAAAINADPLLYVTAAAATNVVTVTAKNDGTPGNQIDLRLNYYPEDSTPAGVAVAIVAMSSGATDIDIDEIIAVMGEDQYNVIVHPWSDASNLTKIEAELADRFGPIRQNDGVAFTAKKDTLGNLTTLGNGRNSPHSSIMGVAGPTVSWEWAAAVGAQVAKSGQKDPARPLQTLPLEGILSPAEAEKFTLTERNNLLFDGIATFKVVGGQAQLERVITTYQTNAAGAADTSYLDVETLLTLSYLRFSFRTRMLSKFARHKLANDGTRFGHGQKVLTPIKGRAEAVALFAEWEQLGLVEGLEQFKRDLIVERSAQDPSRLDFLLPPDLINQLRVVGAQVQFLL